MADVPELDPVKVVVKKEVMENPESPDHGDVQDSPTSQADTNGGQKLTKVWGDNETRSMLEFHKNFMEKHNDGNYSKKQLLEEVAQELNLIGFEISPEKVRNKMKYLRARYKRMLEYNAKHVVKKSTPFQDELAELYSMPFFEDEPMVDINGLNNSVAANKSARMKKKTNKNGPSSRLTLKAVLNARKKSSMASKASKIIKKKAKARKGVHPLFQCGLCMAKFHSSSEMHGHSCTTTPVKVNPEGKKKMVSRSPQKAFHWNGLITMQFLEALKEHQETDRNFNIRKGYIWENISQRMKVLGYKIPVEELSKKWNLLSTSYERTVAYNRTHKDKKKCAYFKRLMELHNHKSFNGIKQRNMSAKRTVEVSPFSFKRGPLSTVSSIQSSSTYTGQMLKEEMAKQTSTPEVIAWLNNTWTEYKEMERRRQNAESQRHNEIMEMLSYLVESRNLHH